MSVSVELATRSSNGLMRPIEPTTRRVGPTQSGPHYGWVPALATVGVSAHLQWPTGELLFPLLLS